MSAAFATGREFPFLTAKHLRINHLCMTKEIFEKILKKIEAKKSKDAYLLGEQVKLSLVLDAGSALNIGGIKSLVLTDEYVQVENEKETRHYVAYGDIRSVGVEGHGKTRKPGFA